MKIIEISSCDECPYKETFVSAINQPYCGKLTQIVYDRWPWGRIPSLDINKTTYIIKDKILDNCPLKDK